jgi:hypothetical protein
VLHMENQVAPHRKQVASWYGKICRGGMTAGGCFATWSLMVKKGRSVDKSSLKGSPSTMRVVSSTKTQGIRHNTN